MKKIFLPILSILLGTLILAVMPTEADAALYNDTVRLHILANSDSEDDQNLKLAVRDALLCEYGGRLCGFENAEEAKGALTLLLPEIEDYAASVIRDCGYGYSVNVTLTDEFYKTRDYEDFSLPSGTYSSLRVIIGEGEGKNWWCVMFPPLCLDMSLSDFDGYTDEELFIVQNKYSVKFKLLELASELLK